MKVQEIMTRPPQTCPSRMRLTHASLRMRNTGCGTLLVLDAHGALVGIITDRDLALAIADRDAASTAVEEVMTTPVHVCRPDEDVAVALETMSRHKVRRLPVVTATGDVRGALSVDDIILWGLQNGVGIFQLVNALRSICSADRALLDAMAEA